MDPIITPLFVSGLAALGVGAQTAAAIAPWLTSFVLAAGTTLASYLLAPKPPKPDDGKFVIQQSTPPRMFAYGTVRLAGATMLLEQYRKSLYHVVALCSHRISAFEAFYLNDDRITIGVSTPDTVDQQADGRYNRERVKVWTRLGVVPETNYSDITADLPTEWPATARGDGIASLAMIANSTKPDEHSEIFPYGRPIPSAVIDGALLYDPREGTHDPDDESTWEFSRNAALIILHWLCFSEFGFRKDYDTAILPVVNDWMAAADICDELVTTYNEGDPGSEPRYHISGWGTTENDPKAILAQMLMGCDGWLVTRGDGTCILRVGRFFNSGVTITDDDIVGFYYARGKADEDAVNRLNVSYTSPEHDYTKVECDPWDDLEDQGARGIIRDRSYDLEWTRSFSTARRLAKREMYRQQQQLRGYLELKLSAMNAAYERFVRIESASIPSLSGIYVENRACRFDLMKGGFRLEFLVVDSDIDDWTASTDEGAVPPVPEPPTQEAPYIPANVAAAAASYTSGSGVTGIVLNVSWDDPGADFDDLNYIVRWRIQDTGAGSPGEWVEQTFTDPTASGGRIRVTTNFVPADTILEVEVASVGSKWTKSDWSDTDIVSTSLAGQPIGLLLTLTRDF